MKQLLLSAMLTGLLCSAAAAEVTVEKKATVNGSVVDKVNWSDSAGQKRTIAVVPEKDKEKFWGGYISYLSYMADGKLRECKATGGSLGGFGHLTMHGANPRGWGNSKEDTKNIACDAIFQGPHHAIYRATIEMNTSGGLLIGTVDYFVRDGRSDFIWAVTFDTQATKGLNADSRAPYCEFDWDGAGYGGQISGFGWAAGGKKFRTTSEPLTTECAWDWSADCTIPHVIEWKSKEAGDAEIGLVQTQNEQQHDAGSAGMNGDIGKTGKGLPAGNDVWKLTYQLNCYQGYTTKKTTWMMPYGAVGNPKYQTFTGKTASGKPYQSYALLCVFDKFSQGGADALVSEMETVQNKCKLTATVGTVAEKGPGGAGRTDEVAYAPAGWDQVYGVWTVACAANSADCVLDVADGSITNPTFCFTGYTSPKAPKSLAWNGHDLQDGVDYFASVDINGKRLFVTIMQKLSAKNQIAFKGEPNTTFPEMGKPTVTPADAMEQSGAKVSISVDVKDPDNNLKDVLIDLTPVGGKADTAMAGANGSYKADFELGKDVAPGKKTLIIKAIDADKNTAKGSVAFEVKEIPTVYGEGIIADFEDGTAGGFTGENSKASVTEEKTFGDSKHALKIETGKWGANPKISGDFSHCKQMKFQAFAETEKEDGKATPFLYINGTNTNKQVGPEKGAIPGGKWVEVTIDLSKYPDVKTIMLQTYGVKALYIDNVWVDAKPLGKAKP